VKAAASPEGLSPWEDEFLTSLDERLTKYGSAFSDPDKGQLSAPLSLRQGLKVQQISKKGEVSVRKQNLAEGRQDAKPRKIGKPLTRKSGLMSKGFKPKTRR
jgi:hypothetical protein